MSDEDLLAFYAQGGEEPRLVAGGPSSLEFARTLELLDRLLPSAPADVIDVGGGPGRYAAWLAERGHRVTSLDIVPLHLEQAAARARSRSPFTVAFGDARSLTVGDESCDAVLLMEPLGRRPGPREPDGGRPAAGGGAVGDRGEPSSAGRGMEAAADLTRVGPAQPPIIDIMSGNAGVKVLRRADRPSPPR